MAIANGNGEMAPEEWQFGNGMVETGHKTRLGAVRHPLDTGQYTVTKELKYLCHYRVQLKNN